MDTASAVSGVDAAARWDRSGPITAYLPISSPSIPISSGWPVPGNCHARYPMVAVVTGVILGARTAPLAQFTILVKILIDIARADPWHPRMKIGLVLKEIQIAPSCPLPYQSLCKQACCRPQKGKVTLAGK